jgi:hypothetical protein
MCIYISEVVLELDVLDKICREIKTHFFVFNKSSFSKTVPFLDVKKHGSTHS